MKNIFLCTKVEYMYILPMHVHCIALVQALTYKITNTHSATFQYRFERDYT